MIDFTVITATFNSQAVIKDCLLSVNNQVGATVQHIIVDGGSTDLTKKILEDTNDELGSLKTYIFDNDEGVYEAWNKALPHVEGEYIVFLGSDDIFASDTVLRDVKSAMKEQGQRSHLYYGKVLKETVEGYPIAIRGHSRDWSQVCWDGPVPQFPPHPATFFSRCVFHEGGGWFAEDLKICSDSLHLGTLMKVHEPIFLDVLTTKFRTGGLSNSRKKSIQKWREKLEVSKRLGIKVPVSVLAWSLAIALISQLRAK